MLNERLLPGVVMEITTMIIHTVVIVNCMLFKITVDTIQATTRSSPHDSSLTGVNSTLTMSSPRAWSLVGRAHWGM
jgi:hypothetical protein